jgi:hypothetical protein
VAVSEERGLERTTHVLQASVDPVGVTYLLAAKHLELEVERGSQKLGEHRRTVRESHWDFKRRFVPIRREKSARFSIREPQGRGAKGWFWTLWGRAGLGWAGLSHDKKATRGLEASSGGAVPNSLGAL